MSGAVALLRHALQRTGDGIRRCRCPVTHPLPLPSLGLPSRGHTPQATAGERGMRTAGRAGTSAGPTIGHGLPGRRTSPSDADLTSFHPAVIAAMRRAMRAAPPGP
ncbi:hypothetical protein GCM10010372_00230 [Streptomyces tauricus]|nr:hypothetical protein GCM10010372_00230 [Streptomyces tauricus]